MRRSLLFLLFLVAARELAAETPLIPRRYLLGNPERTRPRLSPAGDRIAWLAPDAKGVLNVWARPIGADEPRPVTNEPTRPILWYEWSADGKHVLYLQDNGGDELTHLFSADLEAGNVRDLTPWRGVRAQNVLLSPRRPGELLVGLNLRDRKVFDMYRVDLATGAVALEARNPGDVLTWNTDSEFRIRAATAFTKDLESVIRVRDASTDGAEKPWRDLVTMPFERALFDGQVVGGSLVAGFDPDGKALVIHSALGGDKGRLVRVDAATGKELGVLAQDPECDVLSDESDHPFVMTHPVTGAVEAVAFGAATPRWTFFDPAVRAEMDRLGSDVPGFLKVVSRDEKDRKWIVAAFRSDTPTSYVVWDRDAKKATPLFSDCPELLKYPLAKKQAVVIPARDGLPLHSYLTLPPGSSGKNLPLVLNIHGGPWYRWVDDFDQEIQFLANRGYAVLQVNYRGSTGYGLKFLNAGTRQWGLGTQEDLYDAVKWAVEKGIADPKRIAAMGWSGGGFATLNALEQRPDLFRCGVDGVGPADIATLISSFPPYWNQILARWRRRSGDPEHDEELNRRISPRFHVDTIKAPLLIGQGQNDPRVTIADVDRMVKTLRDAKREVVYVVYPDEGHGFARAENSLDFYGRVEDFLARHLGGRTEPWTKVEGATAELR
jgi:dipeptidyl aminopeptidase/acylaminoacyl peptidase